MANNKSTEITAEMSWEEFCKLVSDDPAAYNTEASSLAVALSMFKERYGAMGLKGLFAYLDDLERNEQ